MGQQIRFCVAEDGVRLAYATHGRGSPLVKAANWVTHLKFDWHSPLWRHWWTELGRSHQVVRYGQRGFGLSDRDPDRLTLDTSWVTWRRNLSPEQRQEAELLQSIVRVGWGRADPVFRRVFTTRFVPEATTEQMEWFDELMRISSTPEMAGRMRDVWGEVDVTDLLDEVGVPTWWPMPARTAPCRSRRAGSWRPAFPTPGCCRWSAATMCCWPPSRLGTSSSRSCTPSWGCARRVRPWRSRNSAHGSWRCSGWSRRG